MVRDRPLHGPLLTILLMRCQEEYYSDLERAMSRSEQEHFDYLLSTGYLVEIPDRSPRCYHITESGRELLALLWTTGAKHRRKYSARNINARPSVLPLSHRR